MISAWFFVHVVVLNDPGRLIAVHILYFSNSYDWLGSVAVCELAVFDFSLMLLVMDQLGGASSWGTWIIEGTYFLLDVIWHWMNWNRDCYDRHTGQSAIDEPTLLGIHLVLAGIQCFFGFGAWHLCSYPGICLSDAYDITGGGLVFRAYRSFDPYIPSGIAAHHIASSIVGLVAGIFRICPSLGICSCRMLLVIETVLASSTGLIAWAITLVAGTMWYGSATAPIEFFGPTRYQWDNGLWPADGMSNDEAWSTLPLRLPFYNYIGLNPTDSLLPTGPMINDGISVALGWFGHADYQAADGTGIIRADLPFSWGGVQVLSGGTRYIQVFSGSQLV
jgi:photosystem II CP47 chlorophyll apoprotein